MGCELGCNPTYNVLVTERCSESTLLEVEFQTLKWGRVRDGVSEASVTVPYGCCGKLADVRSWRHELHVIRDGDEVWSGPVVVDVNCRSGVTLVANDYLAWLGRRVIRYARCYDPECGGAPATGPVIAEQLVRDALEPDDPCLLDYLTRIDGGANQEREYKLNSAYTLDALTDLARGGLDFTAIGRRIMLMPEGHVLGRTALLTCDNFLGDVCVSDDGGGAATRAVVTGKAGDTDETVVSGYAGGVDPYYGLIEVLHNDDTIRTAASAAAQAAGLIRNPPPLLVQPPQSAALDPNAPVCISELVPGVEVPVSMDCTCRSATQVMQLVKLDVTVDASGEKVSPLLAPAQG